MLSTLPGHAEARSLTIPRVISGDAIWRSRVHVLV